MPATFDLVTLDSPSPDRLATFWRSVLDLHETEREDGDRWIVLSDSDGARRLGVQHGHTTPGSMHLDVRCAIDEFDGELARLLALGAVRAAPSRDEPYGRIVNLADPDGNPFDLCAYRDW